MKAALRPVILLVLPVLALAATVGPHPVLAAPAGAVATAAPAASPLPAASPDAAARPVSASHAHLHRPGTDVDGDLLTGNVANEIFVLTGNVHLQSDPRVDRAVADASESSDPLTLTADEIDVDRAGMSYVAKGHVQFVQGSRSGRADLAMLNEQAHTLDLIGNADIRDGEHRAVAAKMHYDTRDKQFHGSGDVRIFEPLPTPNPNASATPAPKRKRRLPI